MSARPIVYKGSWPGKWSDLISRFAAQHELDLETTEELEEVHAFETVRSRRVWCWRVRVTRKRRLPSAPT